MKTIPHPPRSRVVVPLVKLAELVEQADEALDQVIDRVCDLLGKEAKLDLKAAQAAAAELLAAAVKLRDALPESKP